MGQERDPASEIAATRGWGAAVGPVVRPTLVAFAGVLLLFAVYEAIERSWLADADVELIFMLHRLRGLAAALVAGGLASWLILRRVPPLLTSAGAERQNPARPIDPEERRLHYARWFVMMRWIALVVAAVLVFAAIHAFGLLPREAGAALGATLGVFALANLGYALHLRRGRAGPRFLALQAYADVGFLIVLLHFSGGIENPLVALTILHVIIAGVVLGRKHAYLIAGVASACFALLAWGEWSGSLTHYALGIFPHSPGEGPLLHATYDTLYVVSRVLVQAATLLLVAFFITSLTDRIRLDEWRLGRFADQSLAQAQLLERALDTTQAALCLYDHELKPYWANDRWKKWARELPAAPAGQPPSVSPAASTLGDGRVRTDEVRIPAGTADGRVGPGTGNGQRVLQLLSAPLFDREGQISHVVTLATDVTDQKIAQAAVIRAERLAALGQMAGQLAHEVNNPIAILSAKARLLLRDESNDLSERTAQEIRKIIDLADRVARIAQGLLSSCRPAPGLPTPLDIRLPIRKVLADIESRAKESGVRIRDDLPAELPRVLASASELEQVFLNLFLNSLDAMTDGGDLRVSTPRELVTMEGGRPGVEVVVADTGVGIPADIRERIFEPFLTTKAQSRSSGLGLSICFGLLRGYGGEIRVESEPGKYTRVIVRLPAAPADHPAVGASVFPPSKVQTYV
jgi:signal transduction histidine kinase